MPVSPSFRTFILEQLGRTVPASVRGPCSAEWGSTAEILLRAYRNNTLYFKVDDSIGRISRPGEWARFNPTGKTVRQWNIIGCQRISSRTPKRLVNGLRSRSVWQGGPSRHSGRVVRQAEGAHPVGGVWLVAARRMISAIRAVAKRQMSAPATRACHSTPYTTSRNPSRISKKRTPNEPGPS